MASAAPQPEADKIVPLAPGEALTADVGEGDSFGVELLFELRLLRAPAAPTHLGALPAMVTAAQSAHAGVIRASVAGSRARMRFGAHAFAIDEGYELRGDRGRGGAILVLPGNAYRVVPNGALRSLLNDRRVDVMPLAASQVAQLGASTHLGRATVRTRISTAWGTLDLDQIAPPGAPRAAPRSDARSDAGETGEALDGGEALCRTLLELIASNRALGGAPCAEAMIPVRAEIGYATGGGLLLEVTSLREGTIARSDVAFPPPSSFASRAPVPDGKFAFATGDALLTLRAKGDPASLELSNKTPTPKLAVIDGVSLGVLAGGAERAVALRASRYVIEWRTPLGEIVERAAEVDVPGKASVAQWVPPPLSSASPIASARNGP